MQYRIFSLEEIYNFIGREDKVAFIKFIEGSESYNLYGESITGDFIYTQRERDNYENLLKEKSEIKTNGYIKVNELLRKVSSSLREKLSKVGIHNTHIEYIYSNPGPYNNTYISDKIRSIKEIEIPLQKQPKGGDYNWMYGFTNKLVKSGVEFFWHEMDFYLGMKLHFEPEALTESEKTYAFENGKLKEPIERHYLELKFDKEIISSEEELKWNELSTKHFECNVEILKQELQNVGSNMNKLYSENNLLFIRLLTGAQKYLPERLNGFKGKPIYLDWSGYLHVYIRHVEEFKINNAFADKDKFLWEPRKVTHVIKEVIEKVDDEIQDFWKRKPNQRFSKYGEQTLYYEGDYYTFHIEGDGKLSTFHRDKNIK